jgi:pimeloyl-ACP methyl ester carboxylesterase
MTRRLPPEQVIALHCSGAGAGQWRQLGELLGSRYQLIAPEHYGTDSVGPWTGERAFALADEAVRTLAIIDGTDRSVHLVGHSYGGGLALHVALERPDRIASLALYEPSAFHLLDQIDGGTGPLAEIMAITREAGDGVVTGDYRGAAAAFVDYWSGRGTWSAMRPEVQKALTRWAPKAPLDFASLIYEQTRARAYARLRCPVLIIRGEHALAPTRLIAETLPSLLPNARLAVLAGAGHMGPLTHTAEVNALIAQHLTDIEARGLHSRARGAAQIGDDGKFSTAGAAP